MSYTSSSPSSKLHLCVYLERELWEKKRFPKVIFVASTNFSDGIREISCVEIGTNSTEKRMVPRFWIWFYASFRFRRFRKWKCGFIIAILVFDRRILWNQFCETKRFGICIAHRNGNHQVLLHGLQADGHRSKFVWIDLFDWNVRVANAFRTSCCRPID